MSATAIKLIVESTAEQWKGEGHPLPQGCHLCRPEVCWSLGRELIYFTYADLHPRNWMGVEELAGEFPPGSLEGGIRVTRADGSIYSRKVLPFAFWSVKSESSAKRDHSAVYLDRDDPRMVALFCDYMFLEKWTNPLPPRAEYREINGSYGRGFKPYYMAPGDWLVRDRAGVVKVVSDAELQTLRA